MANTVIKVGTVIEYKGHTLEKRYRRLWIIKNPSGGTGYARTLALAKKCIDTAIAGTEV